jgi:hypothetical protein
MLPGGQYGAEESSSTRKESPGFSRGENVKSPLLVLQCPHQRSLTSSDHFLAGNLRVRSKGRL